MKCVTLRRGSGHWESRSHLVCLVLICFIPLLLRGMHTAFSSPQKPTDTHKTNWDFKNAENLKILPKGQAVADFIAEYVPELPVCLNN